MSDFWFIKVIRVEPIGDFRLRFTFSDGSVGEHDFADLVAEDGEMVVPLRDRHFFARVFTEFGAPTWPNGFDMAPHALYERMKDAGELRQHAAE
jgi:hypothetical protein